MSKTAYDKHLAARFKTLHQFLIHGYLGSTGLSSATKGAERELFINSFLKEVFPPSYRFGSGDIIDGHMNKSGQVDIVIEFPNYASFPYLQGGPRLYLSEGVASIIEVKSDLTRQWDEALETVRKVKELKRVFIPNRDQELAGLFDSDKQIHTPVEQSSKSIIYNEKYPPISIPTFIVAYKGWKNISTLEEKAKSSKGLVDGVLIIDPPMYYSPSGSRTVGESALFVFLDELFIQLQKNFMQVDMRHIYMQPRDLFKQLEDSFSNLRRKRKEQF